MNNEHESNADALLREAAERDREQLNEATQQTVKLPPIAEYLVCEAADAGHYDQRLLTALTRRTWSDCTQALMDGLESGLVDNTTGTPILTEKGQAVLDTARLTQGPMTTRAVARIARSLDEQDKNKAARLATAADEVRGVNDALDRLLADDGGSA